MNVLIIEDEALAAERLTGLLLKYNSQTQVLDTLDSVEDSVQWFLNHPPPDLILMDIHLSDGSSFGIFNHIHIQSPIIFTTAYDQYAIQAFKVNSIDYLLKPVSYPSLVQALQKWQTWNMNANRMPTDWAQVAESLGKLRKQYKTRFLVRFGDHIQFKNISEVAYFYADGKIAYLVAVDGRRFIVDYTLEELEDLLDPDYFFRLNRKIITQIGSLKDVKTYSGGRLKVYLQPAMDGEVVVSRERVPDFKGWLDQ